MTLMLDILHSPEIFGNSVIKTYRVKALDSSLVEGIEEQGPTYKIGAKELYKIEKDMAIIVPTCNERIKLLEGVIAGIPNNCTTIVVSSSKREEVDRYDMERINLKETYKSTGKEILMVHQKDPYIGKAFQEGGYNEILEGDLVKDGKAEGMIIGLLIAKIREKKYVGFVDSDNYVPTSVLEYVKDYAAGLI